MLVGLALPLLLLLLVAGAALWGRAFVRARARQRADDEARLAAVLTVAPVGRRRSRRPTRSERGQSRRSIRVLPRVFGLTRSRSRNSATPSS